MNQLLMNVGTLTPIELGFGMRLSSPLVNMASLTSWIFGWNILYLSVYVLLWYVIDTFIQYCPQVLILEIILHH